MEVAASVVGLLGVGAQVSSMLGKFISSSISAPALAHSIQSEIQEFSFVLEKLQPIVLGIEPLNQARASLIDIDQLSFTLTGCVCTFSELEKEVTDLNPKFGGRMDFWDRIKWGRTEATLSQLVQRLQNHKLSLTLILTILTCTTSTEARYQKQSLDEHVFTSVGSTSGGIYRLDFESTLFVSRPYKRALPDHESGSVLSLATSQRPKPRWSLYTAESNDSVLSLPITIPPVPKASLAGATHFPSISLPIEVDTLYNPEPYYSSYQVQVEIRNSALHRAARIGETVEVQRLLEAGVDGDSRDKDNYTSLHIAVLGGYIETVQALLEWGTGVEARESNGWTALHLASFLGTEAIDQVRPERLVDKEPSSDGESSPYTTPPPHATPQLGHKELVQVLLDWGADTEAKDHYSSTPIHCAALSGNEPVVRLLLIRGADIEARNYDGTPLTSSIVNGNEPIVQLLLESGADRDALDQYGRPVLHRASYLGSTGTVELLLNSGTDKEAKDQHGWTPLHRAVWGDEESTVQLLLDRGVDIEARDHNGRTALHHASYKGLFVVAKLLLTRGTEVEASDERNCTPLHSAALGGREPTVRLLLEHGADDGSTDTIGNTPLNTAISVGHTLTIELLQRHGQRQGPRQVTETLPGGSGC